MLQLIPPHVQPLERGHPHHAVWHLAELVHGQIQVLQVLQVPQLTSTAQQISDQSVGPAHLLDSYLVRELLQVLVHGQLQPLQALAAAQFLRNQLDPVVAQQELF